MWLNLDFILRTMSKDVLQISSDVVEGVCTSVVARERGRKMSSLLAFCCSGRRQSVTLDSDLFFLTSAAVLPGSFSSTVSLKPVSGTYGQGLGSGLLRMD